MPLREISPNIVVSTIPRNDDKCTDGVVLPLLTATSNETQREKIAVEKKLPKSTAAVRRRLGFRRGHIFVASFFSIHGW